MTEGNSIAWIWIISSLGRFWRKPLQIFIYRVNVDINFQLSEVNIWERNSRSCDKFVFIFIGNCWMDFQSDCTRSVAFLRREGKAWNEHLGKWNIPYSMFAPLMLISILCPALHPGSSPLPLHHLNFSVRGSWLGCQEVTGEEEKSRCSFPAPWKTDFLPDGLLSMAHFWGGSVGFPGSLACLFDICV